MDKRITAIFLICFTVLAFQRVVAQTTSDSLLCTYFYMESGDIFVGEVLSESKEEWRIKEQLLGEMSLDPREIKEKKYLFKGSKVSFSLNDNTRYTGVLNGLESDAYIVWIAPNGEIRIPKSKVASLEILPEDSDVPQNANATRYLFAPSAIPLEKGSGYYQNAYILLNSANYGITDHISIGGGVGIPLFFFVNPKVGFKVADRFYLSGGAIAATTFIGDNITVAIPFAAATYGTHETNVTLAAGYGLFWFSGDFEHSKYPIATANGMFRLSKRLHLITENWVIPIQRERVTFDPFGQPTVVNRLETYVASGLGLRIQVGKSATFDVAPVYVNVGEALILPYLDFVYKF